MIAGLPWSTWLLLAAAAGIGLILELRFWLRARRQRARPARPGP